MLTIESVHSQQGRVRILETLTGGNAIAVAWKVGGIMAPVHSPQAVGQIESFKGTTRKTKPLSIVTTADAIPELIDFDSVNPNLWPILENPDSLRVHTGGLFFLRAVVKESVALALDNLPARVVSRDTHGRPQIQFFPSDGAKHLEWLVRSARERSMLTAITSLNREGGAAATTQPQIESYAEVAGLALLSQPEVVRPLSTHFGSQVVIGIGRNDLIHLRGGNLSTEVLEAIWERPIYADAQHAPIHPDHLPGQLRLSIELASLRGPELRDAILQMDLRPHQENPTFPNQPLVTS